MKEKPYHSGLVLPFSKDSLTSFVATQSQEMKTQWEKGGREQEWVGKNHSMLTSLCPNCAAGQISQN